MTAVRQEAGPVSPGSFDEFRRTNPGFTEGRRALAEYTRRLGAYADQLAEFHGVTADDLHETKTLDGLPTKPTSSSLPEWPSRPGIPRPYWPDQI